MPLWKDQSGICFYMGITMNEKIVKEIQEQVKKIKAEYEIVNEIIRDDVFSILQGLNNCNVLYYPLDDEVDGCHIEKMVNGKPEQFVFINTSKPREKQAFGAAHELGHIWRVDEKIKDALPGEVIKCEDVVNRFAAELLMPETHFNKAIEGYLKKIGYRGPKITKEKLLGLMAYLMNYFFVPYMAVLYRFNELGRLDSRYNGIMRIYKDSDILEEIIRTEQYTRLNIVTNLKSLDNLQEFLEKAEAEGFISSSKANLIREDFDITISAEQNESEEDIIF